MIKTIGFKYKIKFEKFILTFRKFSITEVPGKLVHFSSVVKNVSLNYETLILFLEIITTVFNYMFTTKCLVTYKVAFSVWGKLLSCPCLPVLAAFGEKQLKPFATLTRIRWLWWMFCFLRIYSELYQHCPTKALPLFDECPFCRSMRRKQR